MEDFSFPKRISGLKSVNAEFCNDAMFLPGHRKKKKYMCCLLLISALHIAVDPTVCRLCGMHMECCNCSES